MPVVIKHVGDDRYLGKVLVRGDRQAVTDISKAKRYKSISTAKAALSNMGYQNSKEVEFVEVAK